MSEQDCTALEVDCQSGAAKAGKMESEKQEITGAKLVVTNSGCVISNSLRKARLLIFKEL
jgi:hypothetical protein